MKQRVGCGPKYPPYLILATVLGVLFLRRKRR